MSALLQAGAAVCALLGVVSAAAVTARSRDLRLGVQVLLELLLGGALLRLAGDPGWRELTATALVVALRVVVR